jgi:hypothetical protein
VTIFSKSVLIWLRLGVSVYTRNKSYRTSPPL